MSIVNKPLTTTLDHNSYPVQEKSKSKGPKQEWQDGHYNGKNFKAAQSLRLWFESRSARVPKSHSGVEDGNRCRVAEEANRCRP